MQTFKFLALPVVGIALWVGVACATLTQLESMSRSAVQLRAQSVASAPTVTASR